MSGGVFGGDEVGALVFDPGHYSFRVGYAGEDNPKAEIPSTVGFIDDETSELGGADGIMPPDPSNDAGRGSLMHSSRKYIIGTNALHVPRKNMEVGTFLKNCAVEDWAMFESVMDHVYKTVFLADSNQHPVLMSEPPWSAKQKRERMTELMFEKYNVPALFLCKTPVLAAFANARASGLVLDSGASHTSAIPVYDGYCLTHAIVSTPLGANFITELCRQTLEQQGIDLSPTYMIANKETVGDRQQPIWTRKPNLPPVTKSYHRYKVQEMLQEFQVSSLQVSDTPFDAETAEKMPSYHFELPTGYNQDLVADRQRIPEALFDPSIVRDKLADGSFGISDPNAVLGVGQIVHASIGRCDIDVRQSLYNGIIVTGGNSLLQGFVDRLTQDLQLRAPTNTKIKILSAAATAERRFGSWIGGSILASLGTFQQMWISKQEYDDAGKTIVEKKCP